MTTSRPIDSSARDTQLLSASKPPDLAVPLPSPISTTAVTTSSRQHISSNTTSYAIHHARAITQDSSDASWHLFALGEDSCPPAQSFRLVPFALVDATRSLWLYFARLRRTRSQWQQQLPIRRCFFLLHLFFCCTITSTSRQGSHRPLPTVCRRKGREASATSVVLWRAWTQP